MKARIREQINAENDRKTLAAIIDLAQRGFPPTIREIGEALDLSSSATVHARVQRLVRAGKITYNPGQIRTIRVLDAGRNGKPS